MIRFLVTLLGVAAACFACAGASPPTTDSASDGVPHVDVEPVPVIVTTNGAPLSSDADESAHALEADAPAKQPAPPRPREADDSVWKVPVFRDDPVRGPNDALVTIVEFSDFECPYCKHVREPLDRVLEAHPKDVRLVWKDNPLPFHPRARPSAILGRLAFAKLGNAGFWKVHDQLFTSQPELEEADLKRIAASVGLAWDPVARAIEKDVVPKLDQSADLASDFGARGTPHFFINGVRLLGAQPFEKFEERVTDALAAAEVLVRNGVPRAKLYEAITKEGKLPEPPERREVPLPGPASPFRGNPNAPVVIQQFSDFQCPFCKRVAQTLVELEKEFGPRVKLVWRHLPLSFHTDAELAAEATEEAFAQRGNPGFWRFHDELFEAQETGIGRDALEAIAQRVGLDMALFRAALDSHRHRDRIRADAKLAKDAAITGTPAFVINGYFVPGAQTAQVFRRAIRRALDDKKRR